MGNGIWGMLFMGGNFVAGLCTLKLKQEPCYRRENRAMSP